MVEQLVKEFGKDPEVMTTSVYKLTIKDIYGKTTKLRVSSIERITSNRGPMDFAEVYKKFSHLKKGALDRPKGEVELLICQDMASLLPTSGDHPGDA